MESVSSTSSANQYGVQLLMQQAARRSAGQAVQMARSLKSQASEALRAADSAESETRFLAAQSLKAQASATLRAADSAEEKARFLTVQSHRDRAYAEKVSQEPVASSAVQQTVAQLPNIDGQAHSRQQIPASTIQSASSAPVVKHQNQVTGTLINTTA